MNVLRALTAVVVLVGSTAASFGQEYIGDQTCGFCHPQKYDDYIQSGHPWKIFQTHGGQPAADAWPHTPLPNLPDAFGEPLQWPDVEYVIGNFFWKARFIDREGYIWTGDSGDSTQWNLATEEFVPYHPGEERPFNCGRCHTTGYEPEGNQFGLPGLVGTWAQDGVRCEACHGPGSEHLVSFGATPPPGGKDCSECHYRDSEFRMPWSGGFMRHHQQSEDMAHSPHDGRLDCNTCHNPHKSVVYGLGGTIKQCTDCHPGDNTNNNYVVEGMEFVECIDCHMPKMGKSAVAMNEFTGDIRGHLFQVMTDPIAAADNVYDDGGSLFWNQDPDGKSAVTLDYACLGCHMDFDPGLTLEQAAAFAKNIHQVDDPPPPTGDTWQVLVPLVGDSFEVSFEEFAGMLMVEMTYPNGDTSIAIGAEYGDLIFWMGASGDLYFGNVDDDAGTMSGILFGGSNGSSVWFAERL